MKYFLSLLIHTTMKINYTIKIGSVALAILLTVLMNSCTPRSTVANTPANLPQTTVEAPASVGNKAITLNFAQSFSRENSEGQGWSSWMPGEGKPETISFPSGNTKGKYPRGERMVRSGGSFEEVPYVTYQKISSTTGKLSVVGIESEEFYSLHFTSQNTGTATCRWSMEASIGEIKGIIFTIQDRGTSSNSRISNNEDISVLIENLKASNYATGLEKLYQKRVLQLLEMIKNRAPVDTVLENANGTTALHNACGLSRVDVVRWLVDHGANVNARTAKGASAETCVGGPNAATIYKILRSANK